MAEAAPGDADAERTRAVLDDRYGRTRAGGPRAHGPRARLLRVAAAVLAVVVVLVVAAIFSYEPVRTQEAAFRVVDPTSAEVTFAVTKAPDVVADCTVVAYNEAFAEVGAATVRVGPDADRTVAATVTVRTVEPPHGARVAGCVVVGD